MMTQLFTEKKICAILRNVSDGLLLDYAKACVNGGVTLFEVAMNTPSAADQIRRLTVFLGKNASVGAGTVIDLQRCQEASAAGAQFFLTPSASRCTLDYCKSYGMPLLPGVMTPTDVALCMEYGYKTMKLFPAGNLPKGYINCLKGPFTGTEYVAVGGVSAQNISDFFDQGYIGVGIGSNLISKKMIENNEWEAAAQGIAKMVDIAQESR